jgi:AcrR family transcriptional regulator
MTPGRTRMTASQRREMVLRAALIEFAARGLDGTPAQDIARRAGISQPYLFRLFPTKKALFLAVVRRCFQQARQVLATAAAGHAGEDALQAMGSAFGQLCQQRTLPLMQLHAYAACTDPDIRAATRAAFGDLTDSIERLTGLPPARVQRWLGTGMLMTATTAMNPPAADIPRHAVAGEWPSSPHRPGTAPARSSPTPNQPTPPHPTTPTKPSCSPASNGSPNGSPKPRSPAARSSAPPSCAASPRPQGEGLAQKEGRRWTICRA